MSASEHLSQINDVGATHPIVPVRRTTDDPGKSRRKPPAVKSEKDNDDEKRDPPGPCGGKIDEYA